MTHTQRNFIWVLASLAAVFVFLFACAALVLVAARSFSPVSQIVSQVTGGGISQAERQRLYSIAEIHGTKPDVDELDAPFRVEAAGKPVDVEVGHAAPLFADFDGDGKPELLVGQFGSGKLRIYPNEGSATQPRFSAMRWFDGTVPTG